MMACSALARNSCLVLYITLQYLHPSVLPSSLLPVPELSLPMEPSLAAAGIAGAAGDPQPQAPPLPYDSSQSQPPSYDHSYSSYHSYSQPSDPNQYPQPSFEGHHYPQTYGDPSHYPYYSHDYYSSSSTTYAQPHPPAYNVPTPQPPQGGATAVDSTANSHPVEPENSAAAAAIRALSELTQFAGKMDAEERARAGSMAPQWNDRSRGMIAAYGSHNYGVQQYQMMDHVLLPPHIESGGRKQRGRGRWGGIAPRGGRGGIAPRGGRGGRGRGSVTSNGNGPDGRAHASRGRGRGRHGVAAGKEPSSARTSQASAAPLKRPIIPVAWCDICRVDCNSLDILEQHKNGKRHKKTVQKMEEIQALKKLQEEIDAQNNPEKMGVEVEEPRIPMECKEESSEQPGTMGAQQSDVSNLQDTTAADSGMVMDIEQPTENAEKSEVGNLESPVEDKPSQDLVKLARGGYAHSLPFRGGTTRPGRGGKRFKNFNSASAKPPKRPRETPSFCNLCNVTCDTQAVFQCHLAGKKHLSKIRRLPVHGVAFAHKSQHPGTQNMHIVDGDAQPKDESGGMAHESSNSQNSAVDMSQGITGMDPQSDDAVKEDASEVGTAETLVSGANNISKDDLSCAGPAASADDNSKDNLPSTASLAPSSENASVHANSEVATSNAVALADDNPIDDLSNAAASVALAHDNSVNDLSNAAASVALAHDNSEDDLSNAANVALAHDNTVDDLSNAACVAPAHDNSVDDISNAACVAPARDNSADDLSIAATCVGLADDNSVGTLSNAACVALADDNSVDDLPNAACVVLAHDHDNSDNNSSNAEITAPSQVRATPDDNLPFSNTVAADGKAAG